MIRYDKEKIAKKDKYIDLNHRIVERPKFLRPIRDHADMMDFCIGEKVRFNPSGRDERAGVLVKYNKKTYFLSNRTCARIQSTATLIFPSTVNPILSPLKDTCEMVSIRLSLI